MFVSLLFSVSLANVQSPFKRKTHVQCFFSAKSIFVCHLDCLEKSFRDMEDARIIKFTCLTTDMLSA